MPDMSRTIMNEERIRATRRDMVAHATDEASAEGFAIPSRYPISNPKRNLNWEVSGGGAFLDKWYSRCGKDPFEFVSPRILVTGSREWDDYAFIENCLGHIDILFKSIQNQCGCIQNKKIPTLISGNCPSGADLMCEMAARNLEWNIELYPAQWEYTGVYHDKEGRPRTQEQYDPLAGHRRNQEMVFDCNPDMVLAFMLNKSKGTLNCINYAKEAMVWTGLFDVRDPSPEAPMF